MIKDILYTYFIKNGDGVVTKTVIVYTDNRIDIKIY